MKGLRQKEYIVIETLPQYVIDFLNWSDKKLDEMTKTVEGITKVMESD